MVGWNGNEQCPQDWGCGETATEQVKMMNNLIEHWIEALLSRLPLLFGSYWEHWSDVPCRPSSWKWSILANSRACNLSRPEKSNFFAWNSSKTICILPSCYKTVTQILISLPFAENLIALLIQANSVSSLSVWMRGLLLSPHKMQHI